MEMDPHDYTAPTWIGVDEDGELLLTGYWRTRDEGER